jgi:hypothetical protein
MSKVFFFSVLAMHCLMAFLIAERYRLEKLRTDLEIVRLEAEAV